MPSDSEVFLEKIAKNCITQNLNAHMIEAWQKSWHVSLKLKFASAKTEITT